MNGSEPKSPNFLNYPRDVEIQKEIALSQLNAYESVHLE
jgi:hypothetical protein